MIYQREKGATEDRYIGHCIYLMSGSVLPAREKDIQTDHGHPAATVFQQFIPWNGQLDEGVTCSGSTLR